MCPERLAGAGPKEKPRGVRAWSFLLEKDVSGHGWYTGQLMKRQSLSARLRGEFNATKGKALSESGCLGALTSTWRLCSAQQTYPSRWEVLPHFTQPALTQRGASHIISFMSPTFTTTAKLRIARPLLRNYDSC